LQNPWALQDFPVFSPAELLLGRSKLPWLENRLNADSGNPKFFSNTDLGAWPIQSVMLKVPNSEK